MHDFAYIDETLDINLTQSYKLSIQLSLNGLSFCIYDPVQNKYIALVHQNLQFSEFNDYLNHLEEMVLEDDLLKHNYKSVNLIWNSAKNSIIPLEVFSKETIKTQFEFTQKMDELDEIHMNRLDYIDSVNIFTIPSQVAAIFSKHHHRIKFFNQVSSFINHISQKYHSTAKKIFVNISAHFIDVIVSEKGKLLLYNNFDYKSDMDMAYYITNIYNQYRNEQDNIEVIFSGLIDKKTDLHEKLKQFIPHLTFEKQPEDFTYSYTFNKIPHHHFINLFNLNHCE